LPSRYGTDLARARFQILFVGWSILMPESTLARRKQHFASGGPPHFASRRPQRHRGSSPSHCSVHRQAA
jgi:hypothetical protein